LVAAGHTQKDQGGEIEGRSAAVEVSHEVSGSVFAAQRVRTTSERTDVVYYVVQRAIRPTPGDGMPKGTYRKKRDAVLEELRAFDEAWADQIALLRTTNPQAFRKEVLKADIVLAARLGRPMTLTMRPKRFGGDEDPALVRRVQELRAADRGHRGGGGIGGSGSDDGG
jgi:hypothetical protein